MQYSLRKTFKKYRCLNDRSLRRLENRCIGPSSFNMNERYLYSVGILNLLWQSWGLYWRTFWLTHLHGGYNIRNHPIMPFAAAPPIQNDNEAIYFLLHLLGKRTRSTGSIVGSYQEPTWGSIDTIGKLSNQLFGSSNLIGSALGTYADTITHFQTVRNAAVHIDKYNITRVKMTVSPYYRVADIKHPTDILFAEELATGKTAIIKWTEELEGFLLLN